MSIKPWPSERWRNRPRFNPRVVSEWRWSERRNRLDPAPIHALVSPHAGITRCGKVLPASAQVSGYGAVTCHLCAGEWP